jgi:hypothetical protein
VTAGVESDSDVVVEMTAPAGVADTRLRDTAATTTVAKEVRRLRFTDLQSRYRGQDHA